MATDVHMNFLSYHASCLPSIFVHIVTLAVYHNHSLIHDSFLEPLTMKLEINTYSAAKAIALMPMQNVLSSEWMIGKNRYRKWVQAGKEAIVPRPYS